MSDCEQPGGLNNDIVDDAASDKEVGEEDECKDGPGGGGLNVIKRCFKTYQTQYTNYTLDRGSAGPWGIVGTLILLMGTFLTPRFAPVALSLVF